MDLLEIGDLPAQLHPGPPARNSLRFILLSDLPLRVNRAADPAAPTRVTWRLIAANNRPIGKSNSIFASVELCLASIDRIRRSSEATTVSVQFHSGQFSSTGSHWTWVVLLEQEAVATSTHRYKRRVECERGLRQFQAAIRPGTALLVVEAVRRLGERL
jgi:uncharacterized protein YegP (UPF0339 family)